MGPRLVHNLSVSQGRYLEIVKAIEEEKTLCPLLLLQFFFLSCVFFPFQREKRTKSEVRGDLTLHLLWTLGSRDFYLTVVLVGTPKRIHAVVKREFLFKNCYGRKKYFRHENSNSPFW